MRGIPKHEAIRTMRMGRGRARAIRTLWSERCSFAEIAYALRVDTGEISRTLRRPVRV